MTPVARAAMDSMYQFIMQQNGGHDPRQVFNIEPKTAQKIEKKIMQDNAFLESINNVPVRDIAGEVLAFGVPQTITKRTATTQADGSVRRPTDPTGLVARSYYCREIEQDAIITWKKIDRWAHLADFYPRFREQVRFAQRRDLLLTMWNGQGYADNTDSTEYPLLQDVNRGFIQFMIENCPENVVGITPDANAPGGYTVDDIRVGPGAGDNGFENIDIAVNFLRDMHIHRLFRKRKTLKVLAGDHLLIRDRAQLMGVPNTTPTERVATQILLKTTQIGELERAESDELPDHLLFVSELANLSHYWQEESVRSQYDETSHGKKGVVSYYYKNCDNVVEIPEACALFFPDAISIPTAFDDSGKGTEWAKASEVWKKVVS